MEPNRSFIDYLKGHVSFVVTLIGFFASLIAIVVFVNDKNELKKEVNSLELRLSGELQRNKILEEENKVLAAGGANDNGMKVAELQAQNRTLQAQNKKLAAKIKEIETETKDEPSPPSSIEKGGFEFSNLTINTRGSEHTVSLLVKNLKNKPQRISITRNRPPTSSGLVDAEGQKEKATEIRIGDSEFGKNDAIYTTISANRAMKVVLVFEDSEIRNPLGIDLVGNSPDQNEDFNFSMNF